MAQGLTVGEYLVEQLAAWGVQRIYGVVGDTLFFLLDSIGKSDKLQFIPTRHESAAAFMASAEAKLTGRMTVCIATSGPGMLNLLNGLADAHTDRAPVLAITGQVPTESIGTGYKQYIDQQVMIQPLAGYSSLLITPQSLPTLLGTAAATAQLKGQVAHLSIPKDLFGQMVATEIKPLQDYQGALPEPGEEQLQRAAQLASTAQRPVLLVGMGARESGEAVVELAKRLDAPIILSLAAKGVVPGNCDYVLGGLGQGISDVAHKALLEADLVIAIGENWWPKQYTPRAPVVLQIDACQENIGSGRPVECALVGPIARVLPRLVEHLKTTSTDRAWLENTLQAKQAWDEQLAAEAKLGGSPIHPAALIRAVEQAAEPNAIICLDVGDHVIWFNRHFAGNQHFVQLSGTWRSMGFGLPAAIASKLAMPEQQVLLITGDGGLQMVMGELSTASALEAGIVVIVVNNGALAMERNRMITAGFEPVGTSLNNPDFQEVAKACGWHGQRVDDASQLSAALQAAMQAAHQRTPALLDVITADTMTPNTNPWE